jgi:hypothetical protein
MVVDWPGNTKARATRQNTGLTASRTVVGLRWATQVGRGRPSNTGRARASGCDIGGEGDSPDQATRASGVGGEGDGVGGEGDSLGRSQD